MKQTRKTVTTTYSSSSGGGGGAGGEEAGTSFSSSSSQSRRSGGLGRPPSPARLSRIQEQEELQGLNDRLAAYIDKVRSLEAENSRLALQVRSTEEVVKREVTSVKTLYESELAELRRLLDETSKEKARLQIEANKYKTDYEDLLAKYNKRDRDANALERRVQVLERQLAEFSARDFEKENQNLKNELNRLEQQLAAAKKQLEEETLLRVDLQNRVKTLKEDLHFKSQVYEQELEESRVRTTTQLEEVDGRIEQEYEARLQDALREIRAQHDYDLQSVKVELETLYESKVEDLRNQLERNSQSSSAAWEELMLARRSVDDLSAEIGRLKSENAGLDLRVKDIDKQLERERDEFRLRMKQRDEEISRLRAQVEELEREYAALLEIKIKLDREIEAYRKLLESEETRLNISASMTEQRSMTTASSSSGGRKRKRMDIGQAVEEYTQRTASSGFSRSATSSCGVDISDVDTDGKFVKLTNTTDKDVHLFHWQIRHVSGDNETRHKFQKNVLKAGQTITVWSADSDQTHNPPSDLVMKGKRWFVSGDMTTTLLDQDETEVASCSMSRNIGSVASYSTRRRGPRDELDGEELQDKDKCFVM
ncbi:lamin-B1 [Aplysia californica]|uniref:Lamin-B1 n=1 Tax=Aplysia californica TaxID=6500 RepID=A0ABM0JIN9_APLCA|nr:lamin-B1 [Aplysia californica]